MLIEIQLGNPEPPGKATLMHAVSWIELLTEN